MGIEGGGHGADGLVVGHRDRALASPPVPVAPGAVQGVLEDRELVGVVAHVVDQLGEQHRIDLGATDQGRVGDRLAALLAAEAGHQVEPLGDRLRQGLELGAIPQEIGAHCEHHENRRLPLGGGGEQQVDQGPSFAHGFGFDGQRSAFPQHPVAEQFLKLVDHHQQV